MVMPGVEGAGSEFTLIGALPIVLVFLFLFFFFFSFVFLFLFLLLLIKHLFFPFFYSFYSLTTYMNYEECILVDSKLIQLYSRVLPLK